MSPYYSLMHLPDDKLLDLQYSLIEDLSWRASIIEINFTYEIREASNIITVEFFIDEAKNCAPLSPIWFVIRLIVRILWRKPEKVHIRYQINRSLLYSFVKQMTNTQLYCLRFHRNWGQNGHRHSSRKRWRTTNDNVQESWVTTLFWISMIAETALQSAVLFPRNFRYLRF
jgi:hypothetical protein